MKNFVTICIALILSSCSGLGLGLGLGVPNESDPAKLNEIGAARLDQQRRPDGAMLAFKMAADEAIRQNQPRELAVAYNGLGRVYMFPFPRRNPALAEEYYRKSLAINESLGFKYYAAENHANLAEIFFDEKKDKLAACRELGDASRLTTPFTVRPAELCEGVSQEDVASRFSAFLVRQKIRLGCN